MRRGVFLDAIGPDAASAETEPAVAEAKLKFESLDVGSYPVARAKVRGGWLVTCGTGGTFYPDPKHAWDGASEE